MSIGLTVCVCNALKSFCILWLFVGVCVCVVCTLCAVYILWALLYSDSEVSYSFCKNVYYRTHSANVNAVLYASMLGV